MDMFDRYTSAFESMAHEADCLMGEYLVHSFVATEADNGFNLKATVQKYWTRLLELLDKFRRFVAEKFQAARAGAKKLIAMLKGGSGGEDSDDSVATELDKTVKAAQDACNQAEELSKKLIDIASRQHENQVHIDEILDELDELTAAFIRKSTSAFQQTSPSMDSTLEAGMEGVVGGAMKVGRRFINTLITADAVMRAIEHLSTVYKNVADNCKRRFTGGEKSDQKFTIRIQGIINRILSALSKLGRGIASIPSRIMGFIKTARGPRTTTEKYDGPDPFAVG